MSRMQEEIIKHQPQTYIGIDVGKSQLDIYIYPHGVTMQIPNQIRSIQALVKKLAKYDIALVALEATSKYHRNAHALLHEAGMAVAVIHPFRARQFADSIGRLAKTDTIDAHSLALYALRMNPEPTIPPDEQLKGFRDLQTARRQVLAELGDLKRQLHTTEHPLAVRQIKARIALSERHKKALEDEIQTIIAECPELKHRFDILTSIPGIGKTTAAILIGDLPELGQTNAREISALAGVAPMNWDSGSKNGKRMIRGGRKHVRNVLYMCAVTSIGKPNALGKTYHNLVTRGKSPKVALTAVMRKLIIIANTLITENRMWQTENPGEIHKNAA